jgi:hypothetical protein
MSLQISLCICVPSIHPLPCVKKMKERERERLYDEGTGKEMYRSRMTHAEIQFPILYSTQYSLVT